MSQSQSICPDQANLRSFIVEGLSAAVVKLVSKKKKTIRFNVADLEGSCKRRAGHDGLVILVQKDDEGRFFIFTETPCRDCLEVAAEIINVEVIGSALPQDAELEIREGNPDEPRMAENLDQESMAVEGNPDEKPKTG